MHESIFDKESALQVGMPEECSARSWMHKRLLGVVDADHILVFVHGGTMYARDIYIRQRPDWSVRQNLQPLEIVCRKIFLGPERGECRNRIESIEVAQPGAGFVMVSPNENRPQLARSSNHLVWSGAISDQISEVPGGVAIGKGFHARSQSLKIGMNVTDNEDAHGGFRGNGIVRPACGALAGGSGRLPRFAEFQNHMLFRELAVDVDGVNEPYTASAPGGHCG